MDKQKEMEYMLRNLQTYNLKKNEKKRILRRKFLKMHKYFFKEET